jgi:hypothetical protein
MKWPMKLALLVLCLSVASVTFAQTEKPLTNTDVLTMTKQDFAPGLIVKAIQTSGTSFDGSAEALVELKNAGVDRTVMEAMLAAHGAKPSAAVEPAHGAAPSLDAGTGDPSNPACGPAGGCLLRDSTEVGLKFATDVNSKSAHEGDPVEFLLDEDLKVGGTVVIPKGAHAVAIVSAAKKAGMMGKPGELNVQLQYLIIVNNHIHLRGTKGKEGDSKTGATVALTVIFGPIGLIKHGKNVDIPIGTPLKAYVDQDIWLPPAKMM